MFCPAFHITKYGVFDSDVAFPKVVTTDLRVVESFEFEFISADCPGETYINGITYPLKCGSLICAKPGHCRNSLLPFKCYYFHIRTEDPQLISFLNSIPNYMMLADLKDLTRLFQEILSIETAEVPEDQLLLGSCILKILRHIYLQCKIISKAESTSVMQHQKKLLEVEQYIREHLCEELRLETLAGICGLSANYFHKLFTVFFGKRPAQYILDCRVAAAKTGLLLGNYSLSELAADCGFSSQTYFCYKFKQATGKTPMEYRREMLGRLKI